MIGGRVLLVVLFILADGRGIQLWTKNKFDNVVVLKHFWKSTGLSPAIESNSRTTFLLSEDEKLNLDFIGALPNEAIKIVRIHWLLDLVTVSEARSEEPVFRLENLDLLIYRLYRNGLTPSFELMGNPSGYFHDMRKQARQWTSLIEKIIHHYSSLYGAEYVREWRFELMNEPDLKQYNFLNMSLDEYVEYFKASEAVVPSLAGPAGLFRANKTAHPLCWGFLDYCNLNPCSLNLITFHRKGDGVGSRVVSEGLKLINALIWDYPNLKGVPFGNDEADIMVGWDKPKEWRADARYAALVIQVVIGHIEEMFVKRNIPFEMLSNDNAFLSFSPNYFTQRTLLARFQMNNTVPSHVQFFKKPVYSAMALLSLLGPYLKDVRYRPGVSGFSYLLTSYKYEETYVGVITDDRASEKVYAASNATRTDVDLRILLGDLTLSGMAVAYLMDCEATNPHGVWRDAGSPDFPDRELRRRMREAEGFQRLFIRKVKPHQTHVKFTLRDALLPSVLAVHVCFEGTEAPGPVSDLRYANVTSNEILLFWKDAAVDSRCILTYVVEFRKPGDAEFRRINGKDSIFLSYQHDGLDTDGGAVGVVGEYRVAAVDYWNRSGPYSEVLVLSG